MDTQINTPGATTSPTHTGAPAGRVGNSVLVVYIIGYFMMYIAVLTPVVSTLAVKIGTVVDASDRVGTLSLVTGVGAFFAFIANPIAGALSDRTNSRFGMRKPWLFFGALAGAIGLVVIAASDSVWQIVLGWAIAQAAFNAAQAAFQAFLPDQVDEGRRGKVAGWVGTAQNVASLVGIGIATALATAGLGTAPMLLFPAALGLIGVLVFTFVLHDRVLPKADAEPFHLGRFFAGFWVSPRQYPDFGWAWLGRFLLLFGFASYNSYQVYFLEDHFDLSTAEALSWQLRLMILQTVLLTLAAVFGGWLSDRFQRRKAFVIIATVLAALGLVFFALAPEPGVLYIGSALFGAGFGTYLAVDLALVTDVLPNPETEGAKNMGVFNIANALPQSLAPAVAPSLLAIGADDGENYEALFLIGAVVIVIGAVSTMFIRGAR